MSFVSANCPSCGGDLQVPDDKEQVICMYCGNNVVLKEAKENKNQVEVENLKKLANKAFDNDNLSEAYEYYNRVLEINDHDSEAWLGKGVVAGQLTWIELGNSDLRIKEMVSCLNDALESCSEDDKEDLKKRAEVYVTDICSNVHSHAADLFDSFQFDDPEDNAEVKAEKAQAIREAIRGYEFIDEILPNQKYVMESVITCCTTILEDNPSINKAVTGFDENDIKNIREKYISKIQKIDPEYKPPAIWTTAKMWGVGILVVAAIVFIIVLIAQA